MADISCCGALILCCVAFKSKGIVSLFAYVRHVIQVKKKGQILIKE